MRSKFEIELRIKSIKGNILKDILDGCFTDHSLQEQRDWIECLEWVLKDGEIDEETE